MSSIRITDSDTNRPIKISTTNYGDDTVIKFGDSLSGDAMSIMLSSKDLYNLRSLLFEAQPPVQDRDEGCFYNDGSPRSK